MKVRDILEAKHTKLPDSEDRLHTISSGAPLENAVEKMVQNEVGSLIVVDSQDEIAGILSERDLVKTYHRFGSGDKGLSVDQAMTEDVLMVTPSDEVGYVMQLMLDHKTRHLPVVTNKQLAGIISIGDVLYCLYQEAKKNNEFLKKYISGTYPG